MPSLESMPVHFYVLTEVLVKKDDIHLHQAIREKMMHLILHSRVKVHKVHHWTSFTVLFFTLRC